MYKKNIAVVMWLVFLLGLFFQYNRMDGFVKLLSNYNVALAENKAELTDFAPDGQGGFVLIYDPDDIYSIYLKKIVTDLAADHKKETQPVRLNEVSPALLKHTGGVLVLTSRYSALDGFAAALLSYVEQGGSVGLLMRPNLEDAGSILAQAAGYGSVSGESNVSGIKFVDELLVNMQSLKCTEAYETSSLNCSLASDVKVRAESSSGVPLWWQRSYGAGRINSYNGSSIADKTNRALLGAMLTHSQPIYLYPIVGTKVVFLDDFPAPTPEGNFERLYEELGMNTRDFYRQVWWPYMLKISQRYNIKYTGLIIQTYDDNVQPPFERTDTHEARNNLVIYGRELLKSGGELGVHGYNHQSLAGKGYGLAELGYQEWQSEADMEAALRELKSYIEAVFPKYELRSYVPPSNILSPEGKQALKTVFPSMTAYCALYNGVSTKERAYYQDFRVNDDDTCEFPRTSSGYVVKEQEYWETMSILSVYGIVSHFIHPDEMFYEESKDLTWRQMEEGFEDFMAYLDNDFGWLRACTISEAVNYLRDYKRLRLSSQLNENELTINIADNSLDVYLMLRSERAVKSGRGCEVTAVGQGWYLLKTRGPELAITFEGE